ncbi:hypothetical protein M446_5968 [Methylobacterium sp. 4-46]|uniref:hypothetical protein n=1 Tax=unclassified Methylobacterium TaxID=2615210 RepID=UPI000165CB7C|nr:MULTISPECIES: hypothetical protein [Methylobacterium]ACA20248.1 hypothetical protein M446_5968 [Methylobacterium sp. 4-46]WFT79424.1 hypothetical protein QA634_30125 [Methylobacterium nodulans]
MPTELDRLVVSLEANLDAYERALDRAAPLAERALGQAERAVAASAARMQAAMARAGEGVRGEIVRMVAQAPAAASAVPAAQAPRPAGGAAAPPASSVSGAPPQAAPPTGARAPARRMSGAEPGPTRAGEAEEPAPARALPPALPVPAPAGAPAPAAAAPAFQGAAPASPPAARPGTSAAPDGDAFRSEVARLTKRTGLLRVEAETLGLSEGAAARAEAAFRLLDAAKKADLAVTPALTAEVEKVAAAYGAATQQVEDAERAQRAFQQASRDFGSALSGALKGAILDGERLNAVLSRFAITLAARSIDRTVEGFLARGGAGGDLLGEAAKGLGLDLNPTGRAEGGPVVPGVAYTVGERGRETFVPLQPGRIVPAARGPAAAPAPAPIQVSVVVQTPDAPSFARAEAQVTAALARAVQRGLRGQ